MAARLVTEDGMSDDRPEIPAVNLAGSSMLAIVQAIPELEARTGREATVIGGLAVLCRLGIAYRATSDLDTANRRAIAETPQLEVLLRYADVSQAGPAGVWIPTSSGKVKVDVIEVTDSELNRLPDDETDRLAVLSHAWAIQTATLLRIRASRTLQVASTEVLARTAEPGPLIAMKLQSIMNRPVEKERTDLLDIVRLILDQSSGPKARAQLREADAQLAEDASLHAQRWFVERKDATLRLIRELPEGADIDADTIQLVSELLLAELDRPAAPTSGAAARVIWGRPQRSPALPEFPNDRTLGGELAAAHNDHSSACVDPNPGAKQRVGATAHGDVHPGPRVKRTLSGATKRIDRARRIVILCSQITCQRISGAGAESALGAVWPCYLVTVCDRPTQHPAHAGHASRSATA